jgi:hypothetical protein
MRILGLALAALVLSIPAAAQLPYVLGTVDGFVSPEGLGSQNALAGLGDIDNDGVPDFVAGAPSWPMPHPTLPGQTIAQVGKARVFSGATLSQLFEVTGTFNLQALGKSVANAGDVDNDGKNDVAVGAPMFGPTVPGQTPPPPQVQVWSGATGTLLYTITSGSGGFSSSNFGISCAGVGDVGQLVAGVYSPNPDGFPDILVGASTGNAAAVYSGQNGALLYSMSATTINPPLPAPPLLTGADNFGETVAAAGDVTGDGVPDLLVCARTNNLGGAAGGFNSGAVFLLSGNLGAVVNAFVGGAGDAMGQSATSLGDVNGDGRPEIAIGSTKSDVGGADTGSVTVYDGLTLLALWTTHGILAGDNFGYSLAAVGDITGDGRPDLLVGTPTTDVGATNTGSATLLDGGTGARLGAIDGLLASDLMGRSVAALGDRNGDGTPDVLVAAPSADVGGTSTGTVTLVSFGPWLRPSAAGSIPATGGGTFDMIQVNGTGGGAPRRIDLAPFAPLTVTFTQPPTFANPSAPLYAFGLIGVPLASDELFFGPLGLMCFAPPVLNPADPTLFLAANSFVAFEPTALIPVAPTGSWSIPLGGGLPFGFQAALSGATADGPNLYRTNTILINVK